MTPSGSLKVQIDGAARGNPGPAGIGVVLTDGAGRKLKEIATFLGSATNNVAETCALIVGLQEALRLGARQVTVLTDSELLARQVKAEYRVKDPELKWLHVLIRNLVEAFARFEIRHIPRSQNRLADRLASQAVLEGLRRQAKPRRSPSADTPPRPSERPSPLPDSIQPTFW